MPTEVPRRQFLRTAALAGGALGLTAFAAGRDERAASTGPAVTSAAILAPDADTARVEMVKRALLAMQRRAWEQGTASQALLELGEAELVVLMARDAVVNQLKDGRLGVNEGNFPVCDPCANGEPVLFAAKRTGDPFFQRAADRMLEFVLHKAPRNRDGIIYHNMNENQVWVDAIYMLPPYLAVAGQPAEAFKQVAGYRRILQDPAKMLYSHIWDDDLQEFRRKALWATGNGWAMAGMTRLVRTFPASMAAEKAQLASWIRELVEAALPYRRPDGLFHDVLDEPNTFVETNFAQMLAYTLYRGVAGGWLPGAYRETADSLRSAAISKIDAYGLVQGVCGAPRFEKAGTSTEGQSFFLLMESGRRDLARSQC
jgi:rhamnogalacturonyl hydrolase YesR